MRDSTKATSAMGEFRVAEIENLLSAVDGFEAWGQTHFPAGHPVLAEITDYWWRTRRLAQGLAGVDNLAKPLDNRASSADNRCRHTRAREVGML